MARYDQAQVELAKGRGGRRPGSGRVKRNNTCSSLRHMKEPVSHLSFKRFPEWKNTAPTRGPRGLLARTVVTQLGSQVTFVGLAP